MNLSNKKGTNNTIQAFWVAAGSFCAFGVSTVTAMLLSRYLDKEEYGVYRQVLFIYNTFLTVFTLGLPRAYSFFIPREESIKVESLIKKINVLFYGLGAIFSILLFVFSEAIASFLNSPKLGFALKLFSPVPFFLLPTMGIEGIFASFQKNHLMTIYNVVSKSFILICVAIPVLVFGGTYIEAIIGFTCASILSFILSLFLKRGCIPKMKENRTTNLKYKEIFAFALPLLFASLWGILFNSVDKIFVSRWFGTVTFAEYSNGAMTLPFISMIIGACSTVLMPLFSKKVYEESNAQETILPIWLSVFSKTIKLTYPLIFFFLFYATDIMILLYGDAYKISGTYFAINLFVNFFTVISYFPIIIAIGKVKYYRNTQMYGALSLIALCFLDIFTIDNSFVIAALVVICRIGMISSFLYIVAKYFNIGFINIIPYKLLCKLIIISILILAFLKSIDYLIGIEISLFYKILISFCIYVLAFALCAKFFKIDYASIVMPLKKLL